MKRRAVHIAGSLSIVLGVALAAHAGTGPPCRGTPELDFTWPAEPGMLMPSAVAVGQNGDVYVCDGVNDRILRFDGAGRPLKEITGIGDQSLKRPLSLRTDLQGRLWIADTGHSRVLIRGGQGELVRSVGPITNKSGVSADVTDVLPTPDGSAAWCVDNDGHMLLRIDLSSGQSTRVGRQGAALGQLDYPFMIAGGVNGDLFVTDVLNGRVAVFSAAGLPVRTLGQYGLEPGQFYRPKGIAVDDRGRVWVGDAVLGVVQVFDGGGAFIGVLRGADGLPLRFNEPAGLTFDAEGRLYVVESAANRVRRVRVLIDADAPRENAPRVTLSSPQPRICTACHLEWMSPLIAGRGTELLAVPPNPPEHPLVSQAGACRTCHDGTVVDSRRRVWVEHGHTEGMPLPAGMTVRGDLPLVGGRIACRTCHSAHTRGGSGNVLKDAVFLRVERDPVELCSGCHAGFEAGVSAGMHPLTNPAADDLSADRRAHLATCLSCHEAHGARQAHLLTIDPASNDGCLACHATVNAELFSLSARRVHARELMLAAGQQEVVERLGSAVGRDGRLLCRTCHRMHNAPFSTHLLTFDPGDAEACGGCHQSQSQVRGTPHDLRTGPPVAGQAQQHREDNACAHCHRAHDDARPPRPTAVDRVGRCSSCHGSGDFPTAQALREFNHPRAVCIDCHDPHVAGYSHFMRAAPVDVCAGCHAEAARLTDGPHDVRRGSTNWPSAAAATQDPCLACHRPHAATIADLWRAGLAPSPQPRDAACLACHADTAPDGGGGAALLHPQQAASDRATTDTGPARSAPVLCRSCHDPHVATPKLHRLPPGANVQQLCLSCHSEYTEIGMIGHGATFLVAAGFVSEGCQPCHRVHGPQEATDLAALWPQELCREPSDIDHKPLPIDERCLCCHRVGGPAPLPAAVTHPDVEMYNPEPPGSAQHLPLFNTAGAVDPAGRVSCHTCHLTHGRSEPIPLPEGIEVLSAREIRARVWHIRRFVTPNVCTTCHGADAWRRFMYFHDPQRRGGGLESTPAAARQ